MHAKIDLYLRGGITDKADHLQGVKDVTVLILVIHHHLGVGLMVGRQDPYKDPEQKGQKTETPVHTFPLLQRTL